MNQVKIKLTFAGILFALFLGVQLNAQTIQRGKVVLQNSGHKSLPGTQVTAYGAQPTDTDNDGLFQLNFDKAEPGDMTPLKEAYKKGYELVNKQETEKWILSDTKEMIIVMCSEGALKEARKKYYQIGTSTYILRYENVLSELEKQKESNRLTEKEYADKLETAYNELENSQKLLFEYADLFSRINKDDLNELETKAFLLLEEGKLDESIALYENEKLLDKLNAQIQIKKTATEEINEMIPSLKRYAEICVFAGGKENIDKASEIYRTIAEADMSNFENIHNYGKFLRESLTDYNASLEWMLKGIEYAKTKVELGRIHTSLFVIYQIQNDFEKAVFHCNKSIECFNELPKDLYNQYIEYIITAYYNRARFYLNKNDFENAMSDFNFARNLIDDGHVEMDSTSYLFIKNSLTSFNADILQAKFELFSNPQDTIGLFKLFNDNLEYSTQLKNKDFNRYAYGYINTLNNIGTYLHEQQFYNEAENYFQKSLEVCTQLQKTNPHVAQFSIISLYLNLAGIYARFSDVDKIELYSSKASNLLDSLIKINPKIYTPVKYSLSIQMVNLYFLKKDFNSAISIIKESLVYIEESFVNNKEKYAVNLSKLYKSLGDIYLNNMADYQNAELYYKKIEDIAKNNIVPFELLFSTLEQLTDLYVLTKNPLWKDYVKKILDFSQKNNYFEDLHIAFYLFMKGKTVESENKLKLAKHYYRESAQVIKDSVAEDDMETIKLLMVSLAVELEEMHNNGSKEIELIDIFYDIYAVLNWKIPISDYDEMLLWKSINILQYLSELYVDNKAWLKSNGALKSLNNFVSMFKDKLKHHEDYNSIVKDTSIEIKTNDALLSLDNIDDYKDKMLFALEFFDKNEEEENSPYINYLFYEKSRLILHNEQALKGNEELAYIYVVILTYAINGYANYATEELSGLITEMNFFLDLLGTSYEKQVATIRKWLSGDQ